MPEPAVSAADVARRLHVGELTWGDIVLDPASHTQLLALGTNAAIGGLTLAVHGPPGVGKTFAICVWAEALRLDLWRIDCERLHARHSAAASTRGLAEVLALGERPHAILLFHGAEKLAGEPLAALLGQVAERRPPTVLEVRDAAWQTFEPLLPDGVVRCALPFPALGERRRMWELAVCRASPLANVDVDALASLDVPGAIVDAAIRAVVLECGDESLDTASLVAAARAAADRLT